MPIHRSFTICLTLASAVACGAAYLPVLAADVDGPLGAKAGWQTVRDEGARDLRPTAKPHPPQGQRPYVTLRPSTPVVPIGAPISFQVSSSVNGYGHIYVLSASGRVQVWMENVPIAAGQRLLFPTGDMGVRAAAPAGREDLMLIVSKNRIDGFFGHGSTRSPRVLDYSHQAFKQALTAKFIDLPHRQWGYARTSVQVVHGGSGPDGSWGWSSRSPNAWAGQWEDDNDNDNDDND